MGRPKSINPTGEVKKVSVVLASHVLEKLKREALERKVSFGQIVREKLGDNK